MIGILRVHCCGLCFETPDVITSLVTSPTPDSTCEQFFFAKHDDSSETKSCLPNASGATGTNVRFNLETKPCWFRTMAAWKCAAVNQVYVCLDNERPSRQRSILHASSLVCCRSAASKHILACYEQKSQPVWHRNCKRKTAVHARKAGDASEDAEVTCVYTILVVISFCCLIMNALRAFRLQASGQLWHMRIKMKNSLLQIFSRN